MDRRSFIASLFGGIAVAGIGGTAMAKSLIETAPAPVEPAAGAIDPALKAGLDQTDAEFTQYHRRPYPRHHRRPPPPVHHRRPRRVVRNGRVYYVR
uniref:Uncharacterized protein n=1 Tax=Bosea sp. NBC_00436 TaxID=2969620 RepID=A0A9E7ZZM7_9HYPH